MALDVLISQEPLCPCCDEFMEPRHDYNEEDLVSCGFPAGAYEFICKECGTTSSDLQASKPQAFYIEKVKCKNTY